jgi:hypothetical protein
MLKRVSIEVMGSGEKPKSGLVVTPETRATELLKTAGLQEYELCSSLSELPFGPQEAVYDRVSDGTVLTAYQPAIAGNCVR